MLEIQLKETRVYREAKEEGREEGRVEGEQVGRQNEAIALVLKQLTQKLEQELTDEMQSQITSLSLPLLEELGVALLKFEQQADLETWLQAHQVESEE